MVQRSRIRAGSPGRCWRPTRAPRGLFRSSFARTGDRDVGESRVHTSHPEHGGGAAVHSRAAGGEPHVIGRAAATRSSSLQAHSACERNEHGNAVHTGLNTGRCKPPHSVTCASFLRPVRESAGFRLAHRAFSFSSRCLESPVIDRRDSSCRTAYTSTRAS